MKKIFLAGLLNCLFLPWAVAQLVDIYTPNNSLVPGTYIAPEMEAWMITELNNHVDTAHPYATRLSDATNTYNCHSYAFYMSEGGAGNIWIPAPDVYWSEDDKSYLETDVPRCYSKVVYVGGGHSAIATSTPEEFISKWGPWPLMKHHKDDIPEDYIPTELKYYNRNFSIAGPDAVCASPSGGYIIPSLSPGTTVVWSTSYPAYATPTTPNAAQTTLTKYGNGVTNLTATINYTCSNSNPPIVRAKNNILVGFNTPMTGTYNPPVGSSGQMIPSPPMSLDVVNPSCIAFATNMSLPSGSSLTWNVTEDPGVIWGQVGNTVWANFSAIGQRIYLSATVTNDCGSYHQNYIFECTTLSTCGIQPQFAPGPELKLFLFPNPAKEMLQVFLTEKGDNTKKKDIGELWITDKLGNVRFRQQYGNGQKDINVNVSALKPGAYTVLVVDGKKQVSGMFIKD